MAYSTSNRPYLVVGAVAGGFGPTLSGATPGSSDCGGNIWAYRSSDSVGSVMASGYFTDGFKLGLRKGDIMFVTQFSTAMAVSAAGIGVVTASNASSAATVGVLASSSTS